MGKKPIYLIRIYNWKLLEKPEAKSRVNVCLLNAVFFVIGYAVAAIISNRNFSKTLA